MFAARRDLRHAGLDVTILSPSSNTCLSKRRVGVLEKHLEVGLEPGTSLRSGLEGRLLSAEAVVAGSGGVRGTVRLNHRISLCSSTSARWIE